MERLKHEGRLRTDAWTETGVVGHGKVIDLLRQAMRVGRLAHAYLFVGPEAVGKMAVARELAGALLGAAEPSSHPDFFLVERERDPKTGKPHAGIVLDQVHALTGRLSLGAFMGGWKVCILDGAHALNKESANALLKTLEEPHERTAIILVASAADEVLPTVRSRCQVLRFSRVPTAEIAAALAARGVDPEKADLYARLADGRPGRAFAYARDPKALSEVMAWRESLLSFGETAVADRWAVIGKLLPQKMPFQEAVDRSRAFLDVAAELLRDAMLHSYGSGDRAVHADVRGRVEAWARQRGPAGVRRAVAELMRTRRLLDGNANPRAALEHFALSF